MNSKILAKSVQVISNNGQNLGVMPTSQALQMAMDLGLDLVEINANNATPIAKIMDYGKYRFEQAKREKEAKKNQKVMDIKEVRLSLNIDVGDFNTKVNHAKRFLSDGNKVKVSIRFRGREMAHAENGNVIMDRFAEACAEVGTVEKPAKLEGRSMLMFLVPKTTK